MRGEIVLVVAGYQGQAWTLEQADRAVSEQVDSGVRLKDATRSVAEMSGLAARELYNRAIDARQHSAESQ